MDNLIQLSRQFAFNQDSDDDIVFQKQLILIVSVCCCLCGFFWGALYLWFLGPGLTMFFPWLFVVVVGLSIPLAHYLKNHYILVYTQLSCITWITAFIQWSIGSMHNSGIVIAWSFLGPIGALIFLKKEHSIYWIIQFIAIVCISVIAEPQWSDDAHNATDAFRTTFYIMNLCTPTAVVFGASFYFVSNLLKQKEANFSLMKVTEQKNKKITESITYAKRIQSAILPSDTQVNELKKDIFILFKPKDIVAGDFYWLKKLDGNLLVGVCDCTGHGVPGAMVSVICNSALNRSVEEFGIIDPGNILNKSRDLILKEFEKSDEVVQDGMDAAIIKIKDGKLTFSGANNPLWLIRKNGKIVEEIAGNKQTVGASVNPQPFTSHSINVEEGDTVYLFTDGITDQFGGPQSRKFGKKAFRELLLNINGMPLHSQKEMIEENIRKWIGQTVQIDDICILGIRF